VGIPVTLTGSFFTGATSVQFNGKAALFTVVNDHTLVAFVPLGATTGKIKVSTPDGTGVSASNFTVL